MSQSKSHDPQNDLLLRLQEGSGCVYMSDLHLPIFHSMVLSAAETILAVEYPASAWNTALKYITGCAEEYESAEEARAQLLARLDQPNS